MVARVLDSFSTLTPFLGLDRLVKTVVIAAAEHETSGELIDNDDLAVLDHIVDVEMHDAVSLNGLIYVVEKGRSFPGRKGFRRLKYSSAFLTPSGVSVAVFAFSSTM